MTPIVVALGSNVGDPESAIRRAAEEMAGFVVDLRLSRLYSSPPMYVLDQPAFVNAVGVGRVAMGPLRLLAELKEIERRLGRIGRERNGPREIDLDIVAYGVLRYEGPTIELPHPRLAERRFVLEPWLELDPEAFVPGLGSVATLREGVKDQNLVVIDHAAL